MVLFVSAQEVVVQAHHVAGRAHERLALGVLLHVRLQTALLREAETTHVRSIMNRKIS